MKEVLTPEFKEYSKKIINNSKVLCEYLKDKGEKVITDGTDCHLFMWDVRPHGLTGSKVEKVLDLMHITTNKNTILGDKS